ncbi:unnamed protein product [Cylicocyclus nassatus]|uniref:Chromo domain-containing protein n=1 Tax=Cylicocyclus nassatus TaxID=53992 RepID=A0AA36MAH8_CYLNA|nr:unnamed protein product [Cylicocyclus nassatus]
MGRLGEHGAFHETDHTLAPDCGSHSNTESDRDANNDEISPKPAELTEGVIGSSDEEPAAGEGLSEEVYEVEKILDRNEVNGELFYLVRWKGFGQEDDSWEPVENLSLAVKAISEFEEHRKSKKGKKSKTPKSKGKCPRNPEKPQGRSSVSKDQKESSSSKKKSKSFLDDKTESEPETPSEDDDDEYMDKKSSAKKSTRASAYSGTVTKAALKSYSPTTTKVSNNTPTSARIQTVDTMTAAKKALQMRQSWLYDSDSDDDSAPEKENEKTRDEAKEKQKSSANDVDKPKAEEAEKSSERKRKVEDNSAEKKRKKSKVETVSTLDKPSIEEDVWQKVQNGATAAPSTSEDGPHLDQPEIVALAQDKDGRVRVLIGQDGVKKVVSLRDAHDANSWGLVQHILKFARFTDFGH